MSKNLKFLLTTIILCISFITISCSGWVFKVPTGSMIPTINVGDSIVVNKYAFVSGEIKRFDIVVFHPPKEVRKRLGDEDVIYVMRIIGLPNEKLEIQDSKIYINGKEISETFDKIIGENDFKKDYSEIIIPDNEYLVLGDNRPQSEDSRYWQQPTIKKSDVLGKVIEIIPKD